MFKAGQSKCAKTSHHFDRIPLEDDLKVIHACSSHLSRRNKPIDLSRSPLKGVTTWTMGNSWALDDDEELALDDTDELYNKELMADVFDCRPTKVHSVCPKRKCLVRSQISVRAL